MFEKNSISTLNQFKRHYKWQKKHKNRKTIFNDFCFTLYRLFIIFNAFLRYVLAVSTPNVNSVPYLIR